MIGSWERSYGWSRLPIELGGWQSALEVWKTSYTWYDLLTYFVYYQEGYRSKLKSNSKASIKQCRHVPFTLQFPAVTISMLIATVGALNLELSELPIEHLSTCPWLSFSVIITPTSDFWLLLFFTSLILKGLLLLSLFRNNKNRSISTDQRLLRSLQFGCFGVL